MSRQSSATVHALLASQALEARIVRERENTTRVLAFAAGEKSGERRGLAKGMAFTGAIACGCFLAGLVLAPLILPVVARLVGVVP